MGGVPDILFVIDTVKENIAIQEAAKLGIPVIAIVDSNSDPNNITYPVPGNDDASRAIDLYCDLAVQSVLDGIEAELGASGKDLGEASELPGGEKRPRGKKPKANVEQAAAEAVAEEPVAASA